MGLNEIDLEWHHSSGNIVNVHDDGRVGYAYWIDAQGDITGDVWLYNGVMTPIQPPWRVAGAKPPFLNPVLYLKSPTPLCPGPSDITLFWHFDETNLVAEVQVFGSPVAKLCSGWTPGMSALVSRAGPLADTWY